MKVDLIEKLPTSVSSFNTLRKKGMIYVDKTEIIHSIASLTKKFFLARPRRFGKSLLISTFESLFRSGVQHFQGLRIEKLWREKEKFTVIKLDFSEAKNFCTIEDFRSMFAGVLWQSFTSEGFHYDPHLPISLVEQISGWLRQQRGASVVLLIDEYDAPLTAVLGDEALFTKVRMEMAKFFAIVKANDGVFRFFFMTGITKFRQTGIFSELNHLTDLTLDRNYAALLGYTRSEIDQYFSEYVQAAAQALGCSRAEVVDGLTQNYDGFCFDETAQEHVYNPWSVLNFFTAPERGYENYWIESGGVITLLLQYIKTHTLKNPADYQKEKIIPKAVLKASADQKHVSDLALLTQTGYLTIKETRNDVFQVGYPNKEVADAMAQLYYELLLGGKTLDEVGVGGLGTLLWNGVAAEVVADFNRLTLSLDYSHYPVKDEYCCRGFVQAILHGARCTPRIEVHNAFGRSDLELDAGRRHWVFEFKFLPASMKSQKREAAKLLKEAEDQIRDRRYGVAATDSRRELVRLALVFSERERCFTEWKRLE